MEKVFKSQWKKLVMVMKGLSEKVICERKRLLVKGPVERSLIKGPVEKV